MEIRYPWVVNLGPQHLLHQSIPCTCSCKTPRAYSCNYPRFFLSLTVFILIFKIRWKEGVNVLGTALTFKQTAVKSVAIQKVLHGYFGRFTLMWNSKDVETFLWFHRSCFTLTACCIKYRNIVKTPSEGIKVLRNHSLGTTFFFLIQQN